MLFYNVIRNLLLILGVILILEGLDVLFKLGIGIVLPPLFVIVFMFMIGLGFYRYCIENEE